MSWFPAAGRWRSKSFTGFIDEMLAANVGPEGRKYVPYIFSLFMFILFANLLGLLPLGRFSASIPFTFTSHFTATGVLAVIRSFDRSDRVGFWKHGLHFFSLFVPHGTPVSMIRLIPVIELVSFLVRPFSLALRLFVAMMAGHVLLEVLSSFVITGFASAPLSAGIVGVPSFILMVGDLRARTAGCRHPGLCFRSADLALSQRRREPSLSFHQPHNQEYSKEF